MMLAETIMQATEPTSAWVRGFLNIGMDVRADCRILRETTIRAKKFYLDKSSLKAR